jgi:hypothetical protein
VWVRLHHALMKDGVVGDHQAVHDALCTACGCVLSSASTEQGTHEARLTAAVSMEHRTVVMLPR